MSHDFEHSEATGEEGPELPSVETDQPRTQRRLSVYFSYGEGHTFVLEEGDQLIDPLIPEGPDWQPDPIDVEVPKLWIIRAVKDPNTSAIRESIFLKHVAWMRYLEYTVQPKPKVKPTPIGPSSTQRPGPTFRDSRTDPARRDGQRRGSLPPPVGTDPVKL